jgi:GT2 family glycosyltransferase
VGTQSEIDPLVYIVILNWNNADDTIECLQSISNSDFQSYVPIVVDNGSTNGSDKEIRERFPAISMIKLASNLGYAKGNNVGIQYALESGADYILVLNNDTLIDETMLRKLVEFAETKPNAGIVGPLMFCADPENTLFAAGSFINWYKGDTTHRGMYQSEVDYPTPQIPEPADFIVGCGALVSRKFVEEVGIMNTEYFLNYEDVEWGLRAWQNGFEVWFTPDSIMWHKVSSTLGKASPENTYYMTRNALLFFWKNAPIFWRWIAIISILMRSLRNIVAWTIKSQYKKKEYQQLRNANMKAIYDFILGQFGKGKFDGEYTEAAHQKE